MLEQLRKVVKLEAPLLSRKYISLGGGFTSLTVSYCLVSYTGIFKKTQKTQFTCWHSAHEILLGEPSYNFGCGYTYGTRFRKAHSSPGVAIKKQDNAKLAILAYLTKASAARPT